MEFITRMQDLFMIQILVNVIYHTKGLKKKKKDIGLSQYIQRKHFSKT